MTKEQLIEKVNKFQGANREFSQELPDIVEGLFGLVVEAPESAGTAGQVVALDSDGKTVWVDAAEGGTYDAVIDPNSTNAPQSAAVADGLSQLGQEQINFHYYLSHDADFPFDGFILSDGTIEAFQTAFCITDFIKIQNIAIKTCVVRAQMANTYGGGICFYDENKVFISSVYNVVTPSSQQNVVYELDTENIPANAAYIRISAKKSDSDYPYVKIVFTNAGIKNSIDLISEELKGGNVYINLSQEEFISGKFIEADGKEISNAYYCITPFLLIDGLISLKCKANFSNEYGGGIAFYDSKGVFISSIYNVEAGGTSDNQEYELSLSDIPSSAYYFKICAYKATAQSSKSWVSIIQSKCEIINVLSITEQKTNNLDTRFQYNLNKINISLGENDFIINSEFIEASGAIAYNLYYNTTDYLPICGIVSLKVNAVMKNQYGGGICFYDKDFNFISSIYNVSSVSSDSEVGEYTLNLEDIPNGAYFIRVQGKVGPVTPTYVNLVLDTSRFYSDIFQYEKSEDVKTIKEYLTNSAASLTALQVTDTPQTKNLYNIGISMLVDTMGEIQITKGVGAYACGKVSITDTNVIVYDPNSPSTILQTIPHGLTISDLLIIIINVSDTPTKASANTYFATLQICTNGQTFETEIAWTGCSGNAKVESLSGSYSNVKIYFGGEAFKKDIWFFGDSYTDFWCKYAIAFGAKNYMIDGQSGRASTEALTSLRNALKLGLPKAVVWMMGMNNGDTSSAVNATWLADFNTLKSIANEYGFSVIPCTIPNTPSVINYYKNQVIKSSGLDFIDVADILGANEIGSSWFTGLISGDNVHPTYKGAQVIAEYLISCVPKMKI